jgi:hypothetical protein
MRLLVRVMIPLMLSSIISLLFGIRLILLVLRRLVSCHLLVMQRSEGYSCASSHV